MITVRVCKNQRCIAKIHPLKDREALAEMLIGVALHGYDVYIDRRDGTATAITSANANLITPATLAAIMNLRLTPKASVNFTPVRPGWHWLISKMNGVKTIGHCNWPDGAGEWNIIGDDNLWTTEEILQFYVIGKHFEEE
jgi:hypothetical protein